MRTIHLFIAVFFATSPVSLLADEYCTVSISEISSGVFEAVFKDMRVKFEQYNSIAKMKLLGTFGIGDEWTSVKTSSDLPSRISGFRKKQGKEYLIADLVVRESENKNFEWGLFVATKISETQVLGMSYFKSGEEIKCLSTSATKWVGARKKIFGDSFFDVSGVTVNQDVGF